MNLSPRRSGCFAADHVQISRQCIGHKSPNTTHRYVEADLAMKEKALARIEEPNITLRRYRPTEPLLRFLQQL